MKKKISNVFDAVERAFKHLGWASVADVCEFTGLPEDQVRPAVRLLVAVGVLKRVRVSSKVSGGEYFALFRRI